jgi:fatty acid desaturase
VGCSLTAVLACPVGGVAAQVQTAGRADPLPTPPTVARVHRRTTPRYGSRAAAFRSRSASCSPPGCITALAFTADQASSRHGLVRLIARYQGWLFFPLLLLEAAHLHLASIKAIVQGRGRANAVEGLLLVAHVAAYLTALVVVLSPLQAVAFLAVQQGLFGLYLGCAFAPNHKGMPTLTDADQLDFLRRQVLTSRNVTGSRPVDFVLGGLNYQIEHHLFPNMPRPNLRRAQPLIRTFCQQHGLPYTEASLFGSYAEAVRHLHTVGAPLRPTAAAADQI